MNHLYASYQQNVISGGSGNGNANRFAARPQKQWRKQYQNQNNLNGSYRRASVGMPMDRPGGLVPVATPKIQCETCNDATPAKVQILHDSPCKSCNPIINNVQLSNTAYTNNSAYLQSRCSIFDQKAGIVADPAVVYFSEEGIPLEPSSSPLGPQRRQSLACFTTPCQPTIYKPSNTPHAQQGGVSASSRLARLKYNTLNNYPVNADGSIYSGSVFNTSAGADGVNTGRYQIESSPSYFNKYKPQAVSFPRKNGTKIYCNSANTICMSE